ncbi:hypothetical protein [Fangia hongkongensis]|uniref:hypothetical protein n=1 Tax=Fangia hongkongensis TaxID=270495 RepID=UPI000371440A|nr:hypothetical protein [Fangia hongkongensis]
MKYYKLGLLTLTLPLMTPLAYAQSNVQTQYTDPAERVQQLVDQIKKSSENITRKTKEVKEDHENWANSAAASDYTTWQKFQALPEYVVNSFKMVTISKNLSTHLSDMQFEKANRDLDQYHVTMKEMMNGSAQAMSYSTTKTFLHILEKMDHVDLESAKYRYYNLMATAYAIPKKLIEGANIAYSTTSQGISNYKNFTLQDCKLAVEASRKTDLYKKMWSIIGGFTQLVDNISYLHNIKFLHDSSEFSKFYLSESPEKVCSYQKATETLKDNPFMQTYLNSYTTYKNLLKSLPIQLDVSDEHAYSVYAATSAINFITLTEYQQIIDILKELTKEAQTHNQQPIQ